MDNPTILVAIGFFFGAIGLILGFSLGAMRGRRKNAELSVDAPPPPVPTPPSMPVRNTPKDSVEILSVWRNERSGKLVAMLETKPLSPSHITPEQKEKLTHILSGLHGIVGDLTPPTPPVASLPPSAPPPTPQEIAFTPTPVETSPQPSPSSALVETPFAETPSSPTDPVTPGQAEKVYFADTLPEPVGFRQALASNPFKINVPASSQKPANAPKSIVEQIDEIFQEKLVGSPFENQNIQLKESLNGMTILIGSYKYEGVDAVPDPAIRALIKEAAREWNDRVSKRR